jgi:anti-sigma B factor antagonist
MELTLDVQRKDDGITVAVAGEVDLDNAAQLRDTLSELAEETDHVVLDLAGLEFIDSTGLAALLAGHKRLEAEGGRLELQNPPRMLVKMLKLVGLVDVLHVAD